MKHLVEQVLAYSGLSPSKMSSRDILSSDPDQELVEGIFMDGARKAIRRWLLSET